MASSALTNLFSIERASEHLEDARIELLTIDPNPSEKRKLDDAYNAILAAKNAIADLIESDSE